VGRGIRIGLERCTVCGSAHDPDDGEQICASCRDAVARRDRAALTARNVEFLSGPFGDFVKRDPEWYRAVAAEAIERRFFAPAPR
jgi:hypothetical protein